jgi:hypothetical protein
MQLRLGAASKVPVVHLTARAQILLCATQLAGQTECIGTVHGAAASMLHALLAGAPQGMLESIALRLQPADSPDVFAVFKALHQHILGHQWVQRHGE